MTKTERFITENPSHPIVVRFMKVIDKPLSLTGSYGKLAGTIMRLADEAYA
jgi:hypothetical protein